MNAKLTSMMDRQKEQETEINELKKWKQSHLSNGTKGKEAEREGADNDNDEDMESEDGDVVGGSQAPIPTSHGMTGRPPLPGRPGQVLAAIAARARPGYGKSPPLTTTSTTTATTASKKNRQDLKQVVRSSQEGVRTPGGPRRGRGGIGRGGTSGNRWAGGQGRAEGGQGSGEAWVYLSDG